MKFSIVFACQLLAGFSLFLTSLMPSDVAPRGSGSAFIVDGILMINGTELNDTILVYNDSDPNKFSFRLNGLFYRFNRPVRVRVMLDGGNDRLVSDHPSGLSLFVHGGDGDDKLHDRANGCYMMGEGGDDIMITSGPAGDDFYCGYAMGGEGNDILYGGPGCGVLDGGPGDDEIFGGPDGDFIYDGEGNDIVYGGTGDDEIVHDGGVDILVAGPGNDLIYGGSSETPGTAFFGGAGDDEIYGTIAAIEVYGGPGNDQIYGTEEGDYIIGGSGNDEIYAGGGDDYVSCGAGDDVAFAEGGIDQLYGNTGIDELYGDEDDIIRQ